MVWVIAQNKRHKLAKRQGTHRKRTGPAVVSGKRTRSARASVRWRPRKKRHMTTTRDFTAPKLKPRWQRGKMQTPIGRPYYCCFIALAQNWRAPKRAKWLGEMH